MRALTSPRASRASSIFVESGLGEEESANLFRLIADLNEFFAIYNDQDDVEALMLYDEWRAATTVKLRAGKKGKADQVETEAAA